MTHPALLLTLSATLAAGALPARAHAQGARPDTLSLAALLAEARRADPRLDQLELLAAQSRLRERSIAVERLPSLSLDAQAQYQSDVTSLGLTLPGGVRTPSPPHDTWDAYASAQQRLVDPTAAPRRAAERAQLAESRARVHTALYARRQEVSDAFFAALLLQSRAGELAAVITDLDAQHQVVESRVRLGSALPGEAATIRATTLRRRQDLLAVGAERRAALANLGRLVGRTIAGSVILAEPGPDATAVAARAAIERLAADTLRARPEHEQFARTRDRLARQAEVAAAQERPRLSAYARTGYGKPGLDFMNDSFDAYGLAGLRVQWSPFTWGGASREREVLALQRRIVDSDEAAFVQSVQLAADRSRATIERLEAALPLDEEIIALRERIEREARARLREGVVTAAEYVDRRTDVLEARLARSAHLAELAQARIRLLTTLGLEVP